MAVQGPFPGPNTEESFMSLTAGGRIVDVLYGTATLNFGSIAAQSQAGLSIAVTGARPNDIVAMTIPQNPSSGVFYEARVGANDQVNIRAFNITAGAIDPASAVFRVMVYKFAEGV